MLTLVARTSFLQDQLLNISCVHGSVADVDKNLERFDTHDIVLGMDTFHLLFRKYAVRGERERALSALERMYKEGLQADITTYNALFALYININDVKEAEKVSHQCIFVRFEVFTYIRFDSPGRNRDTK